MLKKIVKRNRRGGLPWRSSGWDFAFQCRGCGFDPWRGSWDPRCLPAKNQNINNRSNAVTTSIKTLKMVHIKKKSLKKTGVINCNNILYLIS